jgi:hypothetical protein
MEGGGGGAAAATTHVYATAGAAATTHVHATAGASRIPPTKLERGGTHKASGVYGFDSVGVGENEC